MAHPVQNPAMVPLVQDPVTVVNTVPAPRSAMVLVSGLAITPLPSPAIKRHRAAMVNLLATAAEAAMVDTEVNSHMDATEQTYKRIMK